MKVLVAFSCLLAIAAAKPGVLAPLAYSSPLVAPARFSYSTYVASSPVAYSALAAPVAHTVAASVVHTVAAPVAHTVAAPVADTVVAPVARAVAAPLAHAVAAPVVATAIAPVTAVDKTQYHAQDELGQASYGHSEALQAHNAVQDAAGNKVGSYSYIAPDGQVISANYVADALGYRVASNALPVGPSVVPVAPADTAEVVAARVSHLKEHEVVKFRSRRSVAVAAPVAYSSLTYSAPLVHSAAIPLAYSAPIAAVSPVLRSATLTTVVNTPGHAISYRVD